MWEKKDLVHITNLVKILNEAAKFDISSKQLVEMYSAFVWLDSLKNKISSGLEIKPIIMEAEVKPIEEVKVKKKVTKKKTKKK